MKIEKGAMVALRYAIGNQNGQIITDNLNGQPFRYTVGSGDILPALEKGIEGMEAGEQRSFKLLKTDNPDIFEDLLVTVVVDEVIRSSATQPQLSTFNNLCGGNGCCC